MSIATLQTVSVPSITYTQYRVTSFVLGSGVAGYTVVTTIQLYDPATNTYSGPPVRVSIADADAQTQASPQMQAVLSAIDALVSALPAVKSVL